MSLLGKILCQFNAEKLPPKYYIKFRNQDNCVVHVPVSASNIDCLKDCNYVLNELNKQLPVTSANSFREFGPLFKPGSEFSLRRYSRSNYPGSRRLRHDALWRRYLGDPQLDIDDDSTTVVVTGDPDLSDMERLARSFIKRRIELGLSQVDATRSLSQLYGMHRSHTMLSRFERMDLSLNSFIKVSRIISKWMHDSETPEGRERIMNACQVINANIKAENSPSIPTEFNFPERRPRSYLIPSLQLKLERAYQENPGTTSYEIRHLAQELNLDEKTIRSWFYNRRSRDRKKLEKFYRSN